MIFPDQELLRAQLQGSRNRLETLIPKFDPGKEIYPGWDIKDILAHIAGWDQTILTTLQAHVADKDQVITVKEGITKFNSQSVAARKNFAYDKILEEFREIRKRILETISSMPDGKLVEPFISQWGQKVTVKDLVKIFSEHEDEHAEDMHQWLKNPGLPINKTGS
jgi:hypothetical protein